MITPIEAFSDIPQGLKKPLLKEYNNIVRNYIEHRWTPSELSGGKFCEIVYTILKGYIDNSYPSSPNKPSNFVRACRSLETYTNCPRSFQILIPRLLPALYEVRNNRGVGHVGGDVNPNHMDATLVLSLSNWILAELVRVFHNLKINDAKKIVDSLVERRVPLIWQSGNMKRVLNPNLSLKDQILLLVSSTISEVDTNNLFKWTGYKNRSYFNRILKNLHDARLVELFKSKKAIIILPPGSKYIESKFANIS